MLTKAQLATAKLFLQQATITTEWVANLFFGDGDTANAARLNDIVRRLKDEARARN